MKKTIFTLLFILSLNSVFAFSINDTLQLKNKFNELTIRYQYGDESYNIEEMKFVKNGNKIIATISIPNNEQLEQSETELTKINISSIDKFLTKAFEFKNDCVEKWTSSYVNYYTLNIDKKQIKIYKFCNWEESNFMELKKQIFGNYLIKLDEKRKQLNIKNNELLIGLWKYDNSIHKIEKDKIYTLTRLESKSKENCFLKFKKEQKLVDYYCLKNSKTKYDFKFDIINGDLILCINGENKNDTKDFVYGYTFKVLELNKNSIKLTTLN
ncbi:MULTISPECIES: hypothetical protein [Flavobacterium]|uniref:GLPGLI family protein n=1 Tax=Flavobacterium jumunjinense TaxID=998845 RepID=A0ABV5GPV3_9FLAO|nr:MULTISPECIES: hypothetical protein [Flavobacterium]